jgi:hypothetical protein
MAYIGNQPFTTAFLTDQFSGTGSQTAFTLSAAPANTNSLLVAVTGVLQDPSTYSVNGTTLTFSAAPPSGTANISVRFLGIPASGVTTTAYRTLTEFTATAGQTTFTPPSYTVGFLNVYRNGVLLGTADYTASNGTTVVLASAASAGDLVVTESFYVSSVLNAIPGTAGSVGTSYLVDGSVTPAKLSTGGPSWDTSSNLTVNGLLNISAATAGQIQFPATQNASANANTLDDYEEGTWTPDLKNASSSSTFASKTGRYTKIGRLVYASFVMDAGNTGTAGSDVTLSGLPFAFGGTSNVPTLVAFTANGISSATGCYMSRTANGATTVVVREAAGSAITQQLSFAAGTLIYEV